MAFWIWAAGFRRERISRFVAAELLDKVTSGVSQARWTLRAVLLTGVVIFSIVALARPQWGFKWQEVKRQGVDILVAIDTSKSMLTQDIKPSRLERSKLAVKDLLKKLKGDRIGLLAFSGSAFMVCPLTVDANGFLMALNDLNINTIPRGGTEIAEAIRYALRMYKDVPGKYKALIIMTDGENQSGDPLAAAQEAKALGVKIYCIGVGTKEGELIQIAGSDEKSAGYLKDANGNYVRSRLNEMLLSQIAQTTGGIYVRAAGAQFGLEQIYDQELSKMEKREIESKMEKRYQERYQYPLGVAFLLILVETFGLNRKRRMLVRVTPD